MKGYKQPIKPEDIVSIDGLPLVAKRLADGFLQGIQSSRQRGLGIEFSQYRAYEVGDELSRIDWKLFARSDRYFVREAERESEIDVWFLLDTSRSMLQSTQKNSKPIENNSSSESDFPNKLEYAKTLIASISYLVQNQGDKFGFVSLSSDKFSFVEKGNGKKHWHKLLLALNDVKAGQYFPPIDLLKNHLAQLQRPSIIFLISDFYQQDDEITQFLSQLNRVRSEVVALRLFSKHDETLFFDKHQINNMIRFKDLETEEELFVSAKSAKKHYTKNYNAYTERLNKHFNELGIEYSSINIEAPIKKTLSQYLNKRLRFR
ncbi:MAG: hypothetical protein ACJAS9_002907 [Polaribacter sp.]|jgi:uncharacterized protein (DUF58 family)